MDLSITAAYVKFFNSQSLFPSDFSLSYYHVGQKMMLKTEETNK